MNVRLQMSLQVFAFYYFGYVPGIWMTWLYGSSSFDFLRICRMFPVVVAAFYKLSNSAQVFEFLLILKNGCYFLGFFKSNYINLGKMISYFGSLLHFSKDLVILSTFSYSGWPFVYHL